MFAGKHAIPRLLWLLMSGLPAYCQLPDYHVQLFDESNGIRNDIEKVIMDKRDFIWLASYDQIFRFDGKGLLNFRNRNMSPPSFVIPMEMSGQIQKIRSGFLKMIAKDLYQYHTTLPGICV
jgi:hypothetical protein